MFFLCLKTPPFKLTIPSFKTGFPDLDPGTGTEDTTLLKLVEEQIMVIFS